MSEHKGKSIFSYMCPSQLSGRSSRPKPPPAQLPIGYRIEPAVFIYSYVKERSFNLLCFLHFSVFYPLLSALQTDFINDIRCCKISGGIVICIDFITAFGAYKFGRFAVVFVSLPVCEIKTLMNKSAFAALKVINVVFV